MGMTGRFEWHITCDREHAAVVEQVAVDSGWVYSQITGCPILGQGTYCYITGYATEGAKALYDLGSVGMALSARSVPMLRAKVENIVFDSKTGVNEIT